MKFIYYLLQLIVATYIIFIIIIPISININTSMALINILTTLYDNWLNYSIAVCSICLTETAPVYRCSGKKNYNIVILPYFYFQNCIFFKYISQIFNKKKVFPTCIALLYRTQTAYDYLYTYVNCCIFDYLLVIDS